MSAGFTLLFPLTFTGAYSPARRPSRQQPSWLRAARTAQPGRASHHGWPRADAPPPRRARSSGCSPQPPRLYRGVYLSSRAGSAGVPGAPLCADDALPAAQRGGACGRWPVPERPGNPAAAGWPASSAWCCCAWWVKCERRYGGRAARAGHRPAMTTSTVSARALTRSPDSTGQPSSTGPTGMRGSQRSQFRGCPRRPGHPENQRSIWPGWPAGRDGTDAA
jgi:hypothetical protein